jgi:hypothetical protein
MKRAPQLRPRNPLVALAHRRAAGAHGGRRKTARQAADRALHSALTELTHTHEHERHRHR